MVGGLLLVQSHLQAFPCPSIACQTDQPPKFARNLIPFPKYSYLKFDLRTFFLLPYFRSAWKPWSEVLRQTKSWRSIVLQSLA